MLRLGGAHKGFAGDFGLSPLPIDILPDRLREACLARFRRVEPVRVVRNVGELVGIRRRRRLVRRLLALELLTTEEHAVLRDDEPVHEIVPLSRSAHGDAIYTARYVLEAVVHETRVEVCLRL